MHGLDSLARSPLGVIFLCGCCLVLAPVLTPNRSGSSKVQSLLFDREKFSERDAKKWALGHGFRAVKTHSTARRIRVRQSRPVRGRSYRTIEFTKGIQAVIEVP